MWLVDRALGAAKPRVWITIGVLTAAGLIAAVAVWLYETVHEAADAESTAKRENRADTHTTEDEWRERIAAAHLPSTESLTDDDIATWGDEVCDDMLVYRSVDALAAVYQSSFGVPIENLPGLRNNLLITIDLYCDEFSGK